MSEAPKDVTRLLTCSSHGDGQAASELATLVYAELKKRAAEFFRHERPNHTLQPTALVHEAYLRLVDQTRVDWQGKTHFLAIAAMEMRRVLLDHAKARQTEKRGGDWHRVTLSEAVSVAGEPDVEVLDLIDALDELAALNSRQARMIELRFLGGLTVKETAEILGVAVPTVEKDWRMARAWLERRLEQPRDR